MELQSRHQILWELLFDSLPNCTLTLLLQFFLYFIILVWFMKDMGWYRNHCEGTLCTTCNLFFSILCIKVHLLLSLQHWFLPFLPLSPTLSHSKSFLLSGGNWKLLQCPFARLTNCLLYLWKHCFVFFLLLSFIIILILTMWKYLYYQYWDGSIDWVDGCLC